MDEYGCYRATPEDWDALANLLTEKENILFPYSADAHGAMIININREFSVHGTMPFGGNPHGRAWISILGRGADHIDIDREQFPTYLQEHLTIQKDEAEALSVLLNEVRKRRT